jgi:hypothetical protein
MKACLSMGVLKFRCCMYFFSVAAHEVLPISDAYCGISHSFFCLSARRFISWAAPSDTPRSGMQRILAWVLRSVRLFWHPQVRNVKAQNQVYRPVSTGSEMRMPVLSCTNATNRDGIGWPSKCALTLRRCSTVMGAMVRDNSPSPRM